LFESSEKRTTDYALKTGTGFSLVRQANESKAALTEKGLQQKIIESAKDLGFSWQLMQRGAGHDAQEMAHIAQVAMIFVPSVNGISHSPKEFTKPADMASCIGALLDLVFC
jgi:N-carbamoyl-L-amino-acid hydrolase